MIDGLYMYDGRSRYHPSCAKHNNCPKRQSTPHDIAWHGHHRVANSVSSSDMAARGTSSSRLWHSASSLTSTVLTPECMVKTAQSDPKAGANLYRCMHAPVSPGRNYKIVKNESQMMV